MTYVGPILSLPAGFALFTIIFVVIFMIISEITWHTMKHYPEDEEVYDPESADHFEMQADDTKQID